MSTTRGFLVVPPLAISDANMTTNVPAQAPAWVLGTSYPKAALVLDPVTRLVYESLQADNKGHVPGATDSVLWWLKKGVENRLRMFSGKDGLRTENPDSIVVKIKPGRVMTHLQLFSVRGQRVQVQVTSEDGIVKYDQTVNMVRPSGGGWWAWYFSEIERETRVTFWGLPAYSQATITVTVTNTGGIAACGILVTGRARAYGNTKWGSSIGFVDFGLKERDEIDGSWNVLERGYSDTVKYQVLVEEEMVDRIRDELIPFRSKPILVIGARHLKSMTAYGYFGSFDQIHVSKGLADCNLEVEGVLQR
ncbi:hypothetical protein ACFX58_03440 [Sphingomonas sp. NCPPB 2930]